MPKQKKKSTLYQLWLGQHLEKSLYIFIYGSLLCGGLTAFFYSLLTALFLTSFQLNELFLESFSSRFSFSLLIFMASGSGFGHWHWTYQYSRYSKSP